MTDAAERIKALRERREAARAEGAAAVAAAERAAQRKQRRAARTCSSFSFFFPLKTLVPDVDSGWVGGEQVVLGLMC